MRIFDDVNVPTENQELLREIQEMHQRSKENYMEFWNVQRLLREKCIYVLLLFTL